MIYMPGFQAPGGVTLGSVAVASNFVLGSIGFFECAWRCSLLDLRSLGLLEPG